MDTKSDNTKQRIQFDFTLESVKRLENLKEKTEASTKAEVVRKALKLYELFVMQVDPDCTVEIKDREDTTLFKIPINTLL
ncbi:MAG TPA: hypothetical protein VEP90_19310 [Methylomirabilota bacterium]|nr:hypothetical protein [Methylomirabilota bacterium]